MHLPTLITSTLLAFLPLVTSTALTYKLAANEKACFYAWVDKEGAKVAFYFAVQSGGSFDVDYSVYGPNDKPIMEGTKERQADFVFTAERTGEYRFCFNNEMSTFAEKLVDFEIAVRIALLYFIPWRLTSPLVRLRTSLVRRYLPSKGHLRNRQQLSRSQSSSFPVSLAQLTGIRSISAQGKIVTLALSGVRSDAYLIFQ